MGSQFAAGQVSAIGRQGHKAIKLPLLKPRRDFVSNFRRDGSEDFRQRNLPIGRPVAQSVFGDRTQHLLYSGETLGPLWNLDRRRPRLPSKP